jgi:hypothetical protein
MSDLLYQNFSTVQSDKQPNPVTMSAAATIAPTTKLTNLTGQTQIATITPPVSGYCEITLNFTHSAPGAFSTGGNILTAYQPIQDRPIDLCFDKARNKWLVKSDKA